MNGNSSPCIEVAVPERVLGIIGHQSLLRAPQGAWSKALGGCLILCALLAHGCMADLQGPSPSLESSSQAGGAEQAGSTTVACAADSERWLELRGHAFSPLVAGALAASSTMVPQLILERRSDIFGEQDGQMDARVFAASEVSTQVRWLSSTHMQFRLPPERDLLPGVYDLTVVNASGTSTRREAALGILPAPEVAQTWLSAGCLGDLPEAADATLYIEGRHFVVTGERKTTLKSGNQWLEASAAEDCRLLAPVFGQAQMCRRLSWTGQPSNVWLGQGQWQLASPLSGDAVCASEPQAMPVPLVAGRAPRLGRMEPQSLCASGEADVVELVVQGEDFVQLGEGPQAQAPTLRVGEHAAEAGELRNCEPLPPAPWEATPGGQLCREARYQLDRMALTPRDAVPVTYPVRMIHPAFPECTDNGELALTAYPALKLTSVEVSPVCSGDGAARVVLEGLGLEVHQGQLPRVAVDGTPWPGVGMLGCSPVATAQGLVQTCTALEFMLDAAALAQPGRREIRVWRAEGSPCPETDAIALDVAPRPQVLALEDQVLCLEQGMRVLALHGAGFARGEDGALPTVIFEADGREVEVAATDLAQCNVPEGAARETCGTLEVVLDEAVLAPGTYRLSVRNPGASRCQSVPGPALSVAGVPRLERATPQMACGAQQAVRLTLEGTGFLRIAGLAPRVELGGQLLEAQSLELCEAIGHADAQMETCRRVVVELPRAALPSGIHAVAVVNPREADCLSAPRNVWLAPEPQVHMLSHTQACQSGGPQWLRVEGQDFIQVGDSLPNVHLGGHPQMVRSLGQCETVAGLGRLDVQRCREMLVESEPWNHPIGPATLEVTNPEPVACAAQLPAALATVLPPVIWSAAPELLCHSGQNATIELRGQGFMEIAGQRPEVLLGLERLAVRELLDCAPVPAQRGLPVGSRECGGLRVDVSAQAAGIHALYVLNPLAGGQCASVDPVRIQVLPAAQIQTMTPALMCAESGLESALIEGAGLMRVGGATPTVQLGGRPLEVLSMERCELLSTLAGQGEQCQGMRVRVPPGVLDAGGHTLSATNEAPIACPVTSSGSLLATPRPSIARLAPEGFCIDAFDGRVAIHGEHFIVEDSQAPLVLANGQALRATGWQGCQTLSAPGHQAQTCTSLSLTLPVAMRHAEVRIAVHPDASGLCDSPARTLALWSTPRVDAVAPARLCAQGGALHLQGANFAADMRVELDGWLPGDVQVHSSTNATVTFGASTPGRAALQLTSGRGCRHTASVAVDVTRAPQPLYVDPPIVFQSMEMPVSIYLAGVLGPIARVRLVDDQGGETELGGLSQDPARPGLVRAVVPGGLSPGFYRVIVTDDVACDGSAPALLEVTGDVRLGLSAINPGFGWSGGPTSVVLQAQVPAAPGARAFEATPRVYLRQRDVPGATTARELRGTTFRDASSIAGVVPAGLASGIYDVIAINPDGSVGTLSGAFRVNDRPPVLIDAASPGSWTNSGSVDVLLQGEHIDSPSVAVRCRASAPPSVQVRSWTAQSIAITVQTSNLSGLDVCILRVTNADGSFDDYAPVTVTNPAGNFVAFRPGAPLLMPRRAPAVATGIPGRRQRFLYALGGDTGQRTGAQHTGEFAAIDAFGELGPWRMLPYELPYGLTQARAMRLHDFIYLVGGYARGAGREAPSASILRAHVLDPLDVPLLEDLQLEVEESGRGLEPGVYYYRVSALLPANHPANPGGETLASEPQPVRIPGMGLAVHVTIGWAPYSGARAYRIYRSPAADMPFGQEELLAEIDAQYTRFRDGGDADTSSQLPLPTGALGMWHEVGRLLEARMAHGLALAPSPDPAAPEVFFLYAAGGQGPGEQWLSTIERIRFDVHGPAQQTLWGGVAQRTARGLSSARGELELATASRANASRLPAQDAQGLGMAWLVAFGGRNSAGVERLSESARIMASGELMAFETLSTQGPNHAGHAGAIANNNLVVASAQGGVATGHARKAEICGSSCNPSPTSLSAGWTSLSNVNLVSRYLAGSVDFNGFLYLVGGTGSLGQPLDSTDISVLGGTP